MCFISDMSDSCLKYFEILAKIMICHHVIMICHYVHAEQVTQNGSRNETPTLPSMTPEPDWMKEYGRNVSTASPDSLGYRPKHCWCNRCQIMYRMHKNKDDNLKNWGDYPCFQW